MILPFQSLMTSPRRRTDSSRDIGKLIRGLSCDSTKRINGPDDRDDV
jgi:hypothetical protein